METPHARGWSAVPPELQELILANLSLVEVTRVSWTCKSFHAAFCRQLAREQEARYNLAVGCAGHERILRIKSLIKSILDDDGLDPDVGTHSRVEGWIYRDGTFHSEPPAHHVPGTPEWRAGDYSMHVSVHQTHGLRLSVCTRGTSYVCMYIRRRADRESYIAINLSSDVDTEEVALVQALVSGDLGPSLRRARLTSIYIRGKSALGAFSEGGMEAQVAPLLSLILRSTVQAPWVAGGRGIREHPQAQEVGSAANERFQLYYRVE
jgi:hypothetical protein